MRSLVSLKIFYQDFACLRHTNMHTRSVAVRSGTDSSFEAVFSQVFRQSI